MKNGLLTTAVLAVMAAITPAQATTYTFGWVTPSNENTVLGLTYSETSNGVTLTAYGLTTPSNLAQPATAGPDLYAKSGGTGDTGLGLSTATGGNPGMINDGVQVDFADAISTAPNASATMTVSGLQSGDSWAIYGSNTQLTVEGSSKTDGALGEPLVSGTDTNGADSVTVNLPDWGEYTYYTLMSTGAPMCDTASILMGAVTINGTTTTTSQTPEPASLLMAGTALIVIGLLLKKGQKKV
jgi:hypothetical protein